MAVFIDSSTIRNRHHLFFYMCAIPADDPSLDIVADRIGLKLEWAKRGKFDKYYEVPWRLRQEAIEAGAIPIEASTLASLYSRLKNIR
jgi:hypothetical protein